MDIDGAPSRNIQHGLGQDLAEGDHHRHLGVEFGQPLGPAGITQARRLEHGDARGTRALLDGGKAHVPPAARGSVGLGHRSPHRVVLQQRLECR